MYTKTNRNYLKEQEKKRLTKERLDLSAKIGQLKLVSSDDKTYSTDYVNTKNTFRIIQLNLFADNEQKQQIYSLTTKSI